MIPFNYHHLFYFYAVAKAGSISKACAQLNLAQPTISTQLKQFEKFIGKELFIRDKKKLTLTDEGRHIFFYATEIFDVGREMMDSLSDRSIKGRLRVQIGASDLIGNEIITSLMDLIYQRHPETHISICKGTQTSLLEGLRAHQFDMAVSESLKSSDHEHDIEHHLAGRLPILFCASPSLARRYKDTRQALREAPMIMPSPQSEAYQGIQEYFITHNIHPKIIGEIQDMDIIRRLALSGTGIAALNRFAITRSPESPKLAILGRQEKPSMFENIYILTKKRKKKHPLAPEVIREFRVNA